MKYVLRAVAVLVLVGALGLVGYAYLGDLSPIQGRVEQPVVLHAE